MPLQTVEPKRLYRQIAEQLRSLIMTGEFPVGSRLPAERDLAKQLGVSRPSVREALIAMEVYLISGRKP
jgi:DNA-binding FadR family transcriptional regulator